MPLSTKAMKYLEAWVRRETWHTAHGGEEDYFYMMAHAIARYGRGPFNEDELEALIVEKANRGTIRPDLVEERAKYYASLCRKLVDFERIRTRGDFPNPVIE